MRLFGTMIAQMNFEETNSDPESREKQYTGVRLFKDQVEFIDWLIIHKYRNNRSRSGVIREWIDKCAEEEKNEK
jgi:hypothetical protein